MANLTREEAWELVKEYNKDQFHLRHALTVEGVMRWYANELGYGDEADFWALAGLLHDLDFEMYPEQHCIKSQEIMRERGIDEKLIQLPPATATDLCAMLNRNTRWKSSVCRRRAYRPYRRSRLNASFQKRKRHGSKIH